MSLTIVGGTYLEKCELPQSEELFGSGVRAAASVCQRGTDIELFTFIGNHQFDELEHLARAYGFKLKTTISQDVFEFSYRHPLAIPDWYEPSCLPSEPLSVAADKILCYGMMEGRPIVSGKKIVYDPQAHGNPEPFAANGSEANSLAIVANQTEAYHLSGLRNPREAAQKLIHLEKADAVVVKCGAQGAIVASQSGLDEVPSFRTTRTFKIGSGDIFSATFAYEWLVLDKDPVAAAHTASLSTAYYCQTRSPIIPSSFPSTFSPKSIEQVKRKIYLAAPFFNVAQLWAVDEARRCLIEQGVEVFSPYHDIGYGPPKEVAPKDLKALEECDGVFAILDGFDPGTVFEVGYAVAKQIPVTAVCVKPSPESLSMMTGTNCSVFDDFASAIYWAAWHE